MTERQLKLLSLGLFILGVGLMIHAVVHLILHAS